MSNGSTQAWGLPAPVRRTDDTNQPAVLMPPLPPANDLSIFDDPTDFTQAGAGLEQDAEWKSDDEQESPGGLVYKKKPPHPDDMLNGEVLRTNEALATNARADSFYLVYSPRSKLVKIGITLLSYEECFAKYTKLYGSLESFHFLKIENGKLAALVPFTVLQFK
jgi:hypothetical protein